MTVAALRIRAVVSDDGRRRAADVTAFSRAILLRGMLRGRAAVSAYVTPAVLTEIDSSDRTERFKRARAYPYSAVLYLYPRCRLAAVRAVPGGAAGVPRCRAVTQFTGTR